MCFDPLSELTVMYIYNGLLMQVMKEYELTPREQSLYLYGEVLQHPDKPLRDLGVESGSVLFLKVIIAIAIAICIFSVVVRYSTYM